MDFGLGERGHNKIILRVPLEREKLVPSSSLSDLHLTCSKTRILLQFCFAATRAHQSRLMSEFPSKEPLGSVSGGYGFYWMPSRLLPVLGSSSQCFLGKNMVVKVAETGKATAFGNSLAAIMNSGYCKSKRKFENIGLKNTEKQGP